MDLPRTSNQQLARYEAFTVLSEGCRHLANNCVTKGARGILNKLADAIDRDVVNGKYGNISALMESTARPAQSPCP